MDFNFPVAFFTVISTIFPFIFVGLFITCFFIIVRSIVSQKKTVKRIYNTASSTIQQVLSDLPNNVPNGEKTVQNRTEELLPAICADFPSFSWEEMRSKAKNAVHAVLLVRTTGNLSLLPEECSEELKRQLSLKLADDRVGGDVSKYGDVEPGNAEISDYARRNGFCVVTVQVQVRCKKWTERNGRMISGSRDRTGNTVFSVELILFQDPVRASECGYDLTCPGCGGRISDLKLPNCEYCGRQLFVVNAWRLGEIRER